MDKEPRSILKEFWGYDQFRPLQEEIIASVLEGRDTLALLPTGGGKSICYQVPAMCREGICIVVSPLIALMRDQVRQLRSRGIPALAVYSGMSRREVDLAFDQCIFGKTKFLYLSPERLKSELAVERIRKMKVNLLAVDEAHCISQWGYDFRPSYLEISSLRAEHPEVPVLAVTATATPPVVKDIQEQLHFREGRLMKASFARPNLAYVVLREEAKERKLLDILKKVPGPGVVYVRSRKRTRSIAEQLQRKGISASYYHAGLDPEKRTLRQDDWIRGKIRIMVSTNAFGMGIDKPDVRSVIHMDLPDSLEAYFQEAGRAGRDGERSYAALLYAPDDRLRLERNFEQSFPPVQEIKRVYNALANYYQLAVGAGRGESFDFDLNTFASTYSLKPATAYHSLHLLEQAGWIALTEAVFQPARIEVKAGREELYDIQLKNPERDKLLKALLRAYEGLFHHAVRVNLNELSRFLSWPLPKIDQLLKQLDREDLVDYQPQKDKPQVIFTEARADPANLSIDMARYRFRKQNQQERIHKSIAYAESAVCRSRQLLNYFGETESEACGICDVCLGRTSPGKDPEQSDVLREKIIALLRKEALSISEVADSFHRRQRTTVLEVATFLMDEGIIREEKGKIHLIKKD